MVLENKLSLQNRKMENNSGNFRTARTLLLLIASVVCRFYQCSQFKNNKMKHQDLMYFGYEWDADSKKNGTDFIAEIKDAYDSIKGYRQEVYLEETS